MDDLAARMGLTSGSIEFVLDGHTNEGIAARLGITAWTLQDFLDGKATGIAGLAQALDVSDMTIETLRARLGKQGAAGLLIGLALGRAAPDASRA